MQTSADKPTPDWSTWIDTLASRLVPLESPLPEADRHAAVAIVLRLGQEADVLFMVRAERPNDPWSGQVSFPGGHQESEDDHLLRTAQRETEEEVGLALHECATALGRLESMRARARGKRLPLMVTPFVFLQHTEFALSLGPEASDSFRVPLAPLLDGSLDTHHPIPVEAGIKRYPAWGFESRTIWGMTHHLMGQLLDEFRAVGVWPD